MVDALIALTTPPFPLDGELRRHYLETPKAFLLAKDVGSHKRIEMFMRLTLKVLERYLGMVEGEPPTRADLRAKFLSLSSRSEAALDALAALDHQDYELLQTVMLGRAHDLAASGVELTGAVAIDRSRVVEYLGLVHSASNRLLIALKGSRQDGTRPLRFLVESLFQGWMELGFDRPRVVYGATVEDKEKEEDAPDVHPLHEMIVIIADRLPMESRPTQEAVAYAFRTAVEQLDKGN